jgi:hypothetical protein
MLDTVAHIPLQAAAPVEPPPDVGLLTAEFIPPTTPIAHAWDAQIAQLRYLSVAKKAMGAADRKWRQSLSTLHYHAAKAEQSNLELEQSRLEHRRSFDALEVASDAYAKLGGVPVYA